MKEDRTMEQIHKGILKKFHTLCSVLGLGEAEKRAIVGSYGVESSRDMDTHDLIDVCARLSAQVNERTGAGELDRLRKRVIAAIGACLRAAGGKDDIDTIKGVACRATGYAGFNKIPRERLRNLVWTFNNRVKDMRAVKEMTDGMLLQALPKQGNGRQADA